MKTQKQIEYTIGKLAKASDVGVETVRFYERKGLIKKPSTKEGFRKYSEDDSRKIKFVKRAQDLGFTLHEIKEILEFEAGNKATCADLQKKSNLKIKEIESKIKDLKEMKKSLTQFSEACGTKNLTIKECGILNCFDSGWKCL